ncbi:hypothetical protein O1611_g1931 [Lasiodiplodia mahajangana]|uniref:Uncharacterized protein n=1 Tax=Lasiodiplodia mahajangana TaxID=1108764 RepID=A0ACC2JWB6_9PEZI|nr:hypothetical protein O1611_g1931 [Lasiodiplodia mahajangana]
MLAMDPLSTPTSPLPLSPDQTGQHISTEHVPADLEGSATGIDRKTKKRIQNRVAQRTYRTRIKQRLHDLQQEVHTLRQKEEEQQRDSRPYEAGVNDSEGEGMRFYSPFIRDFNAAPTHGKERSNMEAVRQDGPDIKTTDSGPWAGIPGQSNMWSSPAEDSGYLYNSGFHMPTRPRLELTAGATMQDLSPPTLPINISTSINYSPAYHREHQRDTLGFSSGIEGNLQQPVVNQANNPFATTEEGRVTNFQTFNSPRVSPWGHKVELNATAEGSTSPIAARHANIPQPILYPDGTTAESMMPTPAQWPDNTFPNPQATLEERFEYVLSCAQRAGFDSFDTLSYHYYTRNFNPASALALDQRMSRNRRVPELLAELRKQAASWSTWQRRGYEDEMLKAAEEICITEFNEFRKWEEPESLNETALGDMLPNLGAFLTALVASNPHLSQRQISETNPKTEEETMDPIVALPKIERPGPAEIGYVYSSCLAILSSEFESGW